MNFQPPHWAGAPADREQSLSEVLGAVFAAPQQLPADLRALLHRLDRRESPAAS